MDEFFYEKKIMDENEFVCVFNVPETRKKL